MSLSNPKFAGRERKNSGEFRIRDTSLAACRLIGVIVWALAANAVGAQQLEAQAPEALGRAGSVTRVLAVLQDHAADPGSLGLEDLAVLCADDPLCLGRKLAADNPEAMHLIAVQHPTSDSIRWVTNRPSLSGVTCRTEKDATLSILLELAGFGRKVLREVDAAIAGCLASGGEGVDGAARSRLVLDLRGNGGGDFGRMIKLASYFLGERKAALLLGRIGAPAVPIDLPGGQSSSLRPTLVLVDRETASSAEVLAALLKRYGGAKLLGEATRGKDFIARLVSLDHDWRLLFRAETIEIPGIRLSGGLQPDAPLGPALSEQSR